jgi:hypothetical protein
MESSFRTDDGVTAMFKRMRAACVMIVLASWAPARAELTISIDSTSVTSIPVAGTGTIDVYISSTTGSDQINNYGFALVISGSNPGMTQLQFIASPDPTGAVSDPSYVFGNTGNISGLTFQSPGGLGNAYQAYSQTDFTQDLSLMTPVAGTPVTISTSPMLLGEIRLTTVPSDNNSPTPPSGQRPVHNESRSHLRVRIAERSEFAVHLLRPG